MKKRIRSDLSCFHAAFAAAATSLKRTSFIITRSATTARPVNETSIMKQQNKNYKLALAGVVAFACISVVIGRNDATISRGISRKMGGP